MNFPNTLLALAFASAASVAAAANEHPGRDRPASDANSVDGTGTFSVNPRPPGTAGVTAGPDPADMGTQAWPATSWTPVTQPAEAAGGFGWSVDEVYSPTPQPQALADPDRPASQR
jgi:hypothetical protein